MSNSNFDVSGEERALGTLSHLVALVANSLLLGFAVPIVVMCISDSEFVRNHAKESLNFQISLIIWAVISVLLCLIFIGFFMLVGLAVAAIILPIIASINAASGSPYRYPLIFRFVK